MKILAACMVLFVGVLGTPASYRPAVQPVVLPPVPSTPSFFAGYQGLLVYSYRPSRFRMMEWHEHMLWHIAHGVSREPLIRPTSYARLDANAVPVPDPYRGVYVERECCPATPEAPSPPYSWNWYYNQYFPHCLVGESGQ